MTVIISLRFNEINLFALFKLLSQKFFSKKSQSFLSRKCQEIIITVGKIPNEGTNSWQQFVEGVLQVVYFTVLCLKGYFYTKTIATPIPTNLVAISDLTLFCTFVKTKNKNQNFSL